MNERLLEPHERPIGNKKPFSNSERRAIEKYIKDGLTFTSMSKIMKRSEGSLKAEVKRNTTGGKSYYSADISIERAKEKYKNRSAYLHGGKKIIEELSEKIIELAEKGYSKNRIRIECEISYATVDKVLARSGNAGREIGVYGNERRISSLEDKIKALETACDILFEEIKTIKEIR